MWDSFPVQWILAGCNPVVTVKKIELTEGVKTLPFKLIAQHDHLRCSRTCHDSDAELSSSPHLIISPRWYILAPWQSKLFSPADASYFSSWMAHDTLRATTETSLLRAHLRRCANVQRRQEVKNVYTERKKGRRREEIMKFNGTFCTSSGA